MSEARPPLPPFTEATAIQKIRAAEDAWNTRDPGYAARGRSIAVGAAEDPSRGPVIHML
jgi:nuclear transport factor 2 (NTF2) superfamily protein